MAKGQDSSCWVGLSIYTLSESKGGESEPVLAQRGWEKVGLREGWTGERKRQERCYRERDYLGGALPATIQVV